MSRLFEVYQRLERSLLVTHRGKYAAVVSNSSSAEDEADDVDTFFFDTLEECVRFAKRYPFAYYTRVGSESWVDLVSDDDEDKEQKEEGKEEEDSEATEVLLDEKENEKEEDSEATEVLIDKKEEEWAIGGVIQKNKNNKRHLEWWGQYAALGGGSDEDDEKERGDIGDNEDDWKKRGGRSEAAERERERERLEKWKDEDEDEDEEIEGDTDDDELSEHERYLRRLQRLEDHEWERKGFSTSYYGGGGDTEERNNEEKEKDQYWQSYTTTDNDDWWKTRGAETGWKEYGAQKINKWRQGFNSWKEDARAKIYGSSHGGSYYSFPQRQTCRKYVVHLLNDGLQPLAPEQLCRLPESVVAKNFTEVYWCRLNEKEALDGDVHMAIELFLRGSKEARARVGDRLCVREGDIIEKCLIQSDDNCQKPISLEWHLYRGAGRPMVEFSWAA